MTRTINLDIKFGFPGRRTVMPLLFMLVLCMPVVAGNIGTTTVNTYYPLSYGSFEHPSVSQRFEMKIITLRSSASRTQALLTVSATSFNTVNVTGGVFALGGASIELMPSGSGGRVLIASSSYIDNMLVWVKSVDIPTYSSSPTRAGPGGPYCTPICNGVRVGETAVCDYTAAPQFRLFMRADILFGKVLDGTSLRLYTDQAMTLPTPTGIVP